MVERYVASMMVVGMVSFAIIFTYLFDVEIAIEYPDVCIETVEPFCPQCDLSDSELVSMAEVVEADLEESMPDYDFELWIEDGCIHSCRYLKDIEDIDGVEDEDK